jgi:hypothetical protein
MFSLENEGSETTHGKIFWGQGSAQDDDFYRGSTCRLGHAWIGRKAKAIGQKCEKPWENQVSRK